MRNKKNDMVRLISMDEYGFGPHAMQRLKICKFCGCASSSDERLCRECGRRLPEKNLYQSYKERHKFCKACETVVADNSEYCPECGEKL